MPNNLAFHEPSKDYAFKGVETAMAAFMSELSYLANPVSNHTESAELGNQNVNSLALVSGRYAQKGLEVAQMMAAAHLYSLC